MSFLNYRGNPRLFWVYGRSLLFYATPRKLFNAIRTEYAYRRRLVDVKSAPYILFLEPLYYCNLDCPLCDRQIFPDARKGDAGRFPSALFDRILDEVGDYLFQCQMFGLGEPMLDWKLSRRFIERLHARRIFTLLSTNCTLITPQVAEQAVTCGLDHLVCAIDGISQESYETYRVGGRLVDAMQGMELALAAKRKHRSSTFIEWQFLVHSRNIHEMEGARKLARKMGVHIRFAPLRGMEWDPAAEREWLPSADQLRLGNFPATSPQSEFPCYFLWRSLVLNSNGKATRCLIYENMAEYADLNQMSVLDAYNHPSVQRARQLFSRKPVEDGAFPLPCENCSYFKRHHGGAQLGKRQAPLGLPVLSSV